MNNDSSEEDTLEWARAAYLRLKREQEDQKKEQQGQVNSFSKEETFRTPSSDVEIY